MTVSKWVFIAINLVSAKVVGADEANIVAVDPIQQAILSVDRDFYKRVKLESSFNHEVPLLHSSLGIETLGAQQGSSFVSVAAVQDNHETMPQGRELWHQEPAHPALVCVYSVTVETGSLTAFETEVQSYINGRRRLSRNIHEDVWNSLISGSLVLDHDVGLGPRGRGQAVAENEEEDRSFTMNRGSSQVKDQSLVARDLKRQKPATKPAAPVPMPRRLPAKPAMKPVAKPATKPMAKQVVQQPTIPLTTTSLYGSYGNCSSSILKDESALSYNLALWKGGKLLHGTYDSLTSSGSVTNADASTSTFTFSTSTGILSWSDESPWKRDSKDCNDPAFLFDGTTTPFISFDIDQEKKLSQQSNSLPFAINVVVTTCSHIEPVSGLRFYPGRNGGHNDTLQYYGLYGYKFASNQWTFLGGGSFDALGAVANSQPGQPLSNASYQEERFNCYASTCTIYDKYMLRISGYHEIELGEIVFLYPGSVGPPTIAPVSTAPTMAPTTKNPTQAPTGLPTISPRWECPVQALTPQACDNGLSPGDIVVTAFNTDYGSTAQTVVLLTSSKKLLAGDSFFMTDRPLNCDANCSCDFLPLNETYMDGTVKFTAPSTILPGESIAYSQFKRPFTSKDVYFAFGRGPYCNYADSWTQITWSSQTSDSQFHLYSYSRSTDMTPHDILTGDNIFTYCMSNGKPVILFGLMLTDDSTPEQGWTPYNRNLHSDRKEDVDFSFKVASKKSHKPPNAPAILISPKTIPPKDGVQCTCTDRPEPQYLGCFMDSSERAIPDFYGTMSKVECIQFCLDRGYHYAGRQWTQECWCGGDKSLSDFGDTGYARYGQYDDSSCDCEGPNIGPWRNCVYKLPPTNPDFLNNHFSCDDNTIGWCSQSDDCLQTFVKGFWTDGCGHAGVAEKWQYRNNWRLKVPQCDMVPSEDLSAWATTPANWYYTEKDTDFPLISSQVVTDGFNFLCLPPPDKRDGALQEMAQQTATQLRAEEEEMATSKVNMDKATAILKVMEVKEAVTKCKTEKSMFMPDGITPIKGNESPNTQTTDPRLPKCFGKGPTCMEGGGNPKRIIQLSASAEQELDLQKFGQGKVLSLVPGGGLQSETNAQTKLGTF